MAEARRSPRGLVQWWHGLPWDGLYWLAVLLLLVGAVGFGIKAEIELSRLVGITAGKESQIAEGDLVTGRESPVAAGGRGGVGEPRAPDRSSALTYIR